MLFLCLAISIKIAGRLFPAGNRIRKKAEVEQNHHCNNSCIWVGFIHGSGEVWSQKFPTWFHRSIILSF